MKFRFFRLNRRAIENKEKKRLFAAVARRREEPSVQLDAAEGSALDHNPSDYRAATVV